MRAEISCELAVERFAVFAEMAWLERRPELGLVCRAARAEDDRIAPTSVQSVLPGLGDAGARNVIDWCARLGLCDRGGGLTKLGFEVAETDEAPVPEQGVYELWCAEHPLLGRRILATERLASTRDQRFEHVAQLPLVPDRGVLFRSVVDPRQRFMLRDLPSNHGQVGCLRRDTRAVCRLVWILDFEAGRDMWQLAGKLESYDSAMRSFAHEPEEARLDLWALASHWGAGPLAAFGRWQASERRLAIGFAGLTDAEQQEFRKAFTLPQADVPGKGSYTGVMVQDVPIGPASDADAQRWGMARLDRHLRTKPAYRSRGEVRRLFAELTEDTPLERHSPTLPAHDELAQRYLQAKQVDMFWSVAAPVDLAPRGCSPEELAAMRIGAVEVAQATEERDVIRVPYRGEWSMCRIVERLLAGTVPRRVLLCDRYVRGAENLAGLRLCVQALRQFGPAALDVWTEPGDAELVKQIQAITGQRPRTYAEVFGRAPPHDRFFLVLPEAGPGFGWQMSNSPLDTRADAAATRRDRRSASDWLWRSLPR
jgi:hypothetical protein